jgi:hypothetical protein
MISWIDSIDQASCRMRDEKGEEGQPITGR